MTSTTQARINRRSFLKLTGFTAAAVAASGLPLFHFEARATTVTAGIPRTTPKVGSWEDLYRQRWTWDHIFKGSHGWANCRSHCAWDIYVKNGVVIREEQSGSYEMVEEGIPDFNPRGCQKGACYSEVMYGPSRISVPLKRVGERGSGKWERISWDQAIDEISHKMVDLVQEHGTETIMQDLGPNFDNGGSTLGRFKFQIKAGGTFADMWAEIGDLNLGAAIALGFAHTGGTSDEWYLSDHIVVWMMNPSVTQIPDAHFLYEAKYNGSELVVVDPQYSATSIHADQWLPIETGTDAALAMATARHIWETDNVDWDYVKEQSDLPILVRMDNGQFLRGPDIDADVDGRQLYMWNADENKLEEAPGSEGSDNPKLTLSFDPAIEGSYQVKMLDGTEVTVAPVAALLKEQLEPFTMEAVAEITKLSVEQIFHFADTFAKAERPLILSSWGSNRFLHSDLMNRAKILCVTLKGAVGKRGAGIHTGGFIDLGGFGSMLQTEHEGLYGRLAMIAGVLDASSLYELVTDIIKGRKAPEMYAHDMASDGEKKVICRSTMATEFYNHQGIKETLDRETLKSYDRPLEDYHDEAREKGWEEMMNGSPKIFITGGANLLRRSNQGAKMLSDFWPKIDLAIAVEKKMSFTAMHSDYILPASGWYEKSGIKYTMSYTPYIHYCDAAVPALGECKDEWEIYWLLSKRLQEIAKETNMPVMSACGKYDVDWKQLHDKYTLQGAFGQKDIEKVTQAILDDSPNANGVTIETLKKNGIEKFSGTGENIQPTSQFNPDWDGNGVLTSMTLFTEHKYRWPTYTGRIQAYIDHPWFIDAREALPTHKGSPKAGGDYPFQMVSCHSRWSIHSMWRDIPMLMRMQRGEPVMLLNRTEAEELGLNDNDFAEFHNDLGTIKMRIKYSTMIRPGVAFYFHAWEPHQFPNHESYKWLIPGLPNPLHMAGGDGQLKFGINHFQLGS